jgi:pyridoxamine 5'-phosphate oxidase family protein
MGLITTLTGAELDYLRDQRLGRLATVDGGGAPHVVPVVFSVDEARDAIVVTGFGLTSSRKWRNLKADPAVAFVVDDLETVDPWRPRGVQLRGSAELVEEPGQEAILIRPATVVAWGIDTHPYRPSTRSVD